MANHFSEFVSCLPKQSRQFFSDRLTQETGLDLKYRLTNWQQGKSSVPACLRRTVNRISSEVILDLVKGFIADFDENIIVNLFPMDNEKKTSIKAERALKGISQSDLAEAVGLTKQTIGNIENKKVAVLHKNAVAIAKFFNRKIEDFLEFN